MKYEKLMVSLIEKNQLDSFIEKNPSWIIDNKTIKKEFKFENFIDSQNFVNKVGNLAEEEAHHPDIWFGWGYAKIKIFTHAISGLHESDFVLAAKIDKINFNA